MDVNKSCTNAERWRILHAWHTN